MAAAGSALYNWFGLNRGLFLALNRSHAPVLDQFMLVITWLGHPRLFPFYITAALVMTWRWPAVLPQRNILVFALSYVIVSMVLVPWAKAALDLPRPLAVLGPQAVTVLGHPDPLHSFPSGHAAYATLMAVSLAGEIPLPGQLGLAAFAFLVCVSRIFVGAHFPADVAAGVGISLLVVWGVRWALISMTKEDKHARV
jgi:membrane-associated phospholipid phosphatase